MRKQEINIYKATPIQINWLVAKCEGFLEDINNCWLLYSPKNSVYATSIDDLNYCYDCTKSWPIIEREYMEFDFECNDSFGRYIECGTGDIYRAKCQPDDAMMPTCAKGSSHLIAAMRCYVVAKLGETVEVPYSLE